MIGPVVLQVAGDVYIQGAQIASILWVGATTAGDTVAVHHRGDPENLIWEGRLCPRKRPMSSLIGQPLIVPKKGSVSPRGDRPCLPGWSQASRSGVSH